MPAIPVRCLVTLLLACGALSASAATYHVAPTGDDANPGTLEQPFRTVQHGADQLKPGDTLYLRHGTYFETLKVAVAGTPGQRITIAGYPGEMAVIDGRHVLPGGERSKTVTYSALVLVSGSNVDLQDVWVRRSRGRGLQIGESAKARGGQGEPTRDVHVRNVRVSEAWDAGVGTFETERVVLEECEVFDCVLRNAPPHRGERPWSVSLVVTDSKDTIVRRCTVYRGHGEGIGDLRSDGTIIEDSVSHDHLKITLYLDNSRDSILRRSLLFASNDRMFWRYGTKPTPGLVLTSEPYARQNYSRNQTITNNLIYNTGSGVSVWWFKQPDSTYTDSVIAHNTIVSNRPAEGTGRALAVDPHGARNLTLRNNLVNWAGGNIAAGETAGWTFSHNAWSHQPPEAFRGEGDVLDPRPWPGGEFPDATALRLPASAPEIDAATVVAQVTGDFSSTARDARPDIGAHEFTAQPVAFRLPGVANPHGRKLSVGPVDPAAGATAADFLRGFTADELAAAKKLVPSSPDAAIDQPRPRTMTVTGRVFLDVNENHEADKNDRGLPGVVVSDGHQLARTGEDGSYSITFTVDDERHYRFVAVSHPNGYAPLGPWFFRVPAAGFDIAERADFAFVADDRSAAKSFSFVATSDSQFTQPEEMIAIAKDYAQMSVGPGQPAFLVTAGDLTITGSNWQWDMYDRIRGAARIPVYDGFGGHDGNAVRSTINYEERIGPPWYSWNYGGVHFMQFVSETGYLAPQAKVRQAAWFEADLRSVAPGTPIVLISHTPMDGTWYDARRAEGIGLVAHIVGHFHAVQAGHRDGVAILMSGPARGRDWSAFTNTYRLVHMQEGKLTSELRIAGQIDRLEMLAPAAETRPGAQPLVALAYDSAKRITQVQGRSTAPNGATDSLTFWRAGDWSWHGQFAPDMPGDWTIELISTDEAGGVRRESRTVHVGSWPEKDRASASGPALQPQWVRPTGSVHVQHAAPVVAGDLVYVPVTNPNAGTPGAGVMAVDAQSGRVVWRAASPRGDIRGSVAVRDGRVFAVTAEGWAAAFEANTGKAIWSRPLDEDNRAGRPLALNVGTPVPTAHGLLVPDWRSLQVLVDPATGRELSRTAANTGNYAAFPLVADDTMFTAARGEAAARKFPGGEVVWKENEPARATSGPVLSRGQLFYNTNSALVAREAATGRTLWRRELPSVGFHPAAPVIWGELVLANGANLTAIDGATGEVRWTVECGRDAARLARSQRQALSGSSTPVIVGELAYFGHDDGSLRAVDRQGRLVWEYYLGTPVKTAPVAAGNRLFVHDYAGNLWCFAPAGKGGGE